MANMNQELYKTKPALPNKLLQEDGSITDIAGNAVVGAVDVYNTKPALPNKWLNPDGTYSTLSEILSGIIDTDLFVVVEELPASGESNKIYLLVQGDKIIEYIWVNNKWDPVGMIEFDINNYYTKEQVTQLITAALNEAKAYTDSALTNYVRNTDYATSSKTGVIKTSDFFGVRVSESNGNLYANAETYSRYNNYLGDNSFIGKGTLENVITGKELVNKTYVDNLVGDIETILTSLDVGGGVV